MSNKIKPHLRKTVLAELLGEKSLCRGCKKRPKVKPKKECPLHGVIPPFEGDGLCDCCSSCRGKCFDEV